MYRIAEHFQEVPDKADYIRCLRCVETGREGLLRKQTRTSNYYVHLRSIHGLLINTAKCNEKSWQDAIAMSPMVANQFSSMNEQPSTSLSNIHPWPIFDNIMKDEVKEEPIVEESFALLASFLQQANQSIVESNQSMSIHSNQSDESNNGSEPPNKKIRQSIDTNEPSTSSKRSEKKRSDTTKRKSRNSLVENINGVNSLDIQRIGSWTSANNTIDLFNNQKEIKTEPLDQNKAATNSPPPEPSPSASQSIECKKEYEFIPLDKDVPRAYLYRNRVLQSADMTSRLTRSSDEPHDKVLGAMNSLLSNIIQDNTNQMSSTLTSLYETISMNECSLSLNDSPRDASLLSFAKTFAVTIDKLLARQS